MKSLEKIIWSLNFANIVKNKNSYFFESELEEKKMKLNEWTTQNQQNERKEDFERESLFRGKREREKRYVFRLKHREGERELYTSGYER